MSAEHFLDTNIFVNLFDRGTPQKRHRARELVGQSLANGSGCVSYQVVQDPVNVFTGKLGVSPDSIRRLLDDVLVPLWQVNPTVALYHNAISLQSRYGFSSYDSLIVASALEAGCTRLYSEDLQHDQQIQQLTITNPFLSQ